MKITKSLLKKFLLVSCVLSTLGGCKPLMLQSVEPPGPPEYSLGWEDGCDTGMSAESSWYYKIMYGFKKRPEMAASDQYKQGWNEGFTYCRFAIAKSDAPGDFRDIGMGDGF